MTKLLSRAGSVVSFPLICVLATLRALFVSDDELLKQCEDARQHLGKMPTPKCVPPMPSAWIQELMGVTYDKLPAGYVQAREFKTRFTPTALSLGEAKHRDGAECLFLCQPGQAPLGVVISWEQWEQMNGIGAKARKSGKRAKRAKPTPDSTPDVVA